MAIKYKFDILAALKSAGYSIYRIQKERIMSNSVLDKIRAGDTSLSLATVNTLCQLLNCQPGDIIEYIAE